MALICHSANSFILLTSLVGVGGVVQYIKKVSRTWVYDTRSQQKIVIIITDCFIFLFYFLLLIFFFASFKKKLYFKSYLLIRIFSSAFYHPPFPIRIFPSTCSHPHFVILILLSAIRSSLYRDP